MEDALGGVEMQIVFSWPWPMDNLESDIFCIPAVSGEKSN
jgi:hypothetical protein